ncbi:tyrosine-type recombinase/integrase [Actinophytocola sediminis]
MPVSAGEDRRRGRIEERGANLRVVVYAGLDPVTGRRAYLRETVKGNDRAARKRADKVMTRLLSRVDQQRSTESSIPLGKVIDEWLRVAELEDSTREMYRGYLNRNIRPVLGAIPARKLSARDLETFYAELRRCRVRCDGKPYVEHKVMDDHSCKAEKCAEHECNPLAVSTVRQIHSVISGAMSAAVRWEWVTSNPAKVAQRPRQTPPEPMPPTPAEAAKLIDAAFDKDLEWGTLVWLIMTTGMRRGEVAALRWSNVDLDEGMIEVRQNFIKRNGIEKLKATKTHQMRRIALDTETVVLLAKQKTCIQARCAALGIEFEAEEVYVFTGVHNANPCKPASPDGISARYKTMANKAGVKTHIHALRHYSATELLTAGVDLRTVAGRLGHGGGGATTLRVYAAWVAASDRKAAEILGARLPKRAK